MNTAGWPAPFDAIWRPGRASPTSWSEGSLLLSKVDWQARGLETWGAPTASTSAR